MEVRSTSSLGQYDEESETEEIVEEIETGDFDNGSWQRQIVNYDYGQAVSENNQTPEEYNYAYKHHDTSLWENPEKDEFYEPLRAAQKNRWQNEKISSASASGQLGGGSGSGVQKNKVTFKDGLSGDKDDVKKSRPWRGER